MPSILLFFPFCSLNGKGASSSTVRPGVRPETWNLVLANAQRISFVCIGYFDIKISTCYSLKN